MTEFVAIINITPDSFSDGGDFFAIKNLSSHLETLKKQQINIIDIGAESTRPHAKSISLSEEWYRLYPAIQLAKEIFTDKKDIISIDTYHPETAKKALDLGVNWINDVSGCSDEMAKILSQYKAKLVLMHSLSVPVNPEIIIDQELDVIEEIKKWARDKIACLEHQGIKKDRIIFDPGVGFGKNAHQSLEIIKNISEFKELGLEILVGHSRKSFLSRFTDLPFKERDIETLALSAKLLQEKIEYLRVHNIDWHIRFAKVYSA